MNNYADAEEGQRVLDRAYAQLADRDRVDAEIAEHEAMRAAGCFPERRLPEPDPPPQREKRDRAKPPVWLAAYVQDRIDAALRAFAPAMADAVGRAIAEERAQFREVNDALIARIAGLEQRSADDFNATVFDLRDERRRRA
jgi:hypothetical protein